MVALDNGAADRQPYPHPVTLGRIKRVEQPRHFLLRNSHARILYSQAYTVALVLFRSYDQHPRPIVDAAHRVRCISDLAGACTWTVVRTPANGKSSKLAAGKLIPPAAAKFI